VVQVPCGRTRLSREHAYYLQDVGGDRRAEATPRSGRAINGVKRRRPPKLLSVAADEWLELKKPALAPKSVTIEKTNLSHLLPRLGKLLISDISAEDIAKCQSHRTEEGASPKTVNLVGGHAAGHPPKESSLGRDPARRDDASDP
jgi:hypothetical protein